MPWKEINVLDQRTQFIGLYLSGAGSMTDLCRDFGISRQHGYKLVARYKANGPQGLHDYSSAPHAHPNETARDIIDRIVALRTDHPKWGARKLRDALLRQQPETVWPAASTISHLLDREGLLVHRPRRRRVPTFDARQLTPSHAPNDVWCLDFKGWFTLGDTQPCHPFTLTDHETRFLLRCHALAKPEGASVRAILEAAFREYGLPSVIRSDNGTPFASTGLGGLSRLSLWWLKLGIRAERITPGCPQQNGRHERFHRTLHEELTCTPAATLAAQHQAFQAFRQMYNEERPHAALGGQVPASIYTSSPRPYHPGLQDFRYPEHLAVRIVRANGCVKWRSRDLFISEVLGGEQVAFEELTSRHWALHVGPLRIAVLEEPTRTWVARAEATRLLMLCGLAMEDGLPAPLPAEAPVASRMFPSTVGEE